MPVSVGPRRSELDRPCAVRQRLFQTVVGLVQTSPTIVSVRPVWNHGDQPRTNLDAGVGPVADELECAGELRGIVDVGQLDGF